MNSCVRPPARGLWIIGQCIACWPLLGFLLLCFAPGCAQRSATQTGVYESSYRAGAYATAIEQAERSGDGERAALVAAMARHAMGEGAAARPALERLSGSDDRDVRGRALATLAIIAHEGGDDTEAAALLDRALRDLEGTEASRAETFARVLRGEAVGGGWAVQVGAFESRTRAERASRSARRQVWPGPIRILRDGSSGRELFVVLVGSFANEAEARDFAEQVGGFVRRD